MPTIADRYVHLDAARKVCVEVGDEREAWVLCIPGQELDDETMHRYGLTVKDGLLVLPPPGTPTPATVAEEAAEAPKSGVAAEGDDLAGAAGVDRRAELAAMPKKDLVALGESLGVDVPKNASSDVWIDAILAAEATTAPPAEGE